MNQSTNQRLDHFLDTIVSLHHDLDFSTFWPANPSQLQASYSDLFALEFYSRYLQDNHRFTQALSQLRPNAVRSLLYQAGILGLKVANARHTASISNQALVDYAIKLLDITKSQIVSDEFNRDQHYQILKPNQVHQLVQNVDWLPVYQSLAQNLATFGVSLESLVWSLQFDTFRTAGTLLHGPYLTTKGVLIIKDFTKLKSKVWHNSMFANNIKLYLLYQPGFDLKLNYANQQVSYSQSPIKALRFYALNLDDQWQPYHLSLESQVDEIRQVQTTHVNNLTPLDVIHKGAEIYYALYDDFFASYVQPTKPSSAIYQRIQTKGMHYYELFKHEAKVVSDTYRQLFDPRNSYIG